MIRRRRPVVNLGWAELSDTWANAVVDAALDTLAPYFS